MQERVRIGTFWYRLRLTDEKLLLNGIEKAAIVHHDEELIEISTRLGSHGVALAAAQAVSESWMKALSGLLSGYDPPQE